MCEKQVSSSVCEGALKPRRQPTKTQVHGVFLSQFSVER